ncbi:DUF1848 domain-containing protein [Schaedlerella arabinosiphila]|uniref:DUF1848 domain-containing protein n=1 Tax=Schaedlerella arabinosiphila TaxID=2044587 RepID=A0A9X5CD93_9FIRM|nr:DUF1848 domain-containing protein [Schaedlerella arabinosiphila]KAI4439928.1 hypothetical protein C824_002415 [Schaedlerella arabinosiphila]NDO72392.1 DUF1848 domain-containing protein [Schaedlerella arabinosiphila]
MILSVSRRTDIPAFYAEWFFQRIREGFLYVRNPMNPRQVSRIGLSPEVVDCIIFWSKNPAPMLERLDELREYPFYFQFTLTGYGRDIEPRLPDKRKEVIGTFQKLSEKVGKERVVWRYDPILVNGRYTIEYHLKAFEEIAGCLKGYTEKVVISFVDFYAKTLRNTKDLYIKSLSREEMREIAEGMAQIAKSCGLVIETCAEQINLQDVGIRHGSCIDKKRIEKIAGCSLSVEKDKNQREACGCCESIDVGAYNTCRNGCRYCYANYHEEQVRKCIACYDVDSPLLCGRIEPEERVTDRKVRSFRNTQLSIF